MPSSTPSTDAPLPDPETVKRAIEDGDLAANGDRQYEPPIHYGPPATRGPGLKMLDAMGVVFVLALVVVACWVAYPYLVASSKSQGPTPIARAHSAADLAPYPTSTDCTMHFEESFSGQGGYTITVTLSGSVARLDSWIADSPALAAKTPTVLEDGSQRYSLPAQNGATLCELKRSKLGGELQLMVRFPQP